MTIIVTGGAGFIGSNFVYHMLNKYPDYRIVCVDCLTYAGNLSTLEEALKNPNFRFCKINICDREAIYKLFEEEHPDIVVNFAAESHVDRSIANPLEFARTNVLGTLSLLQSANEHWRSKPEKYKGKLFYHISTDEVYGALECDRPEGTEAPFTTAASSRGGHKAFGTAFFTEETPYAPHSPYSASKASADHFVRSFADTYGMPVIITNCSNNYGPYQHPEKLIPLFINNIVNNRPLPVYGRGLNVRDWLYVEDHVKAIDHILHHAAPGSKYNIGGFNEWRNIDLITLLADTVDKALGRPEGQSRALITYVADRPGHDLRYAIDSRKLQSELGWEPSLQFEEGLGKTVAWYLANEEWLRGVTSGDYMKYYEQMYGNRG